MAECGKGWTNRCAAAKSARCKCRCGGENHGTTRQKVEDDSPRQSSDEELYYAWDEKRRRQFVPDAEAIEKFVFSRGPNREAVVEFLFAGAPGKRESEMTDTELLGELEAPMHLRQRYVRHSPDGFEFGYGGSGPADTALNVLARLIGVKNATELGLYQDFKFDFIAAIPQEAGGTIQAETIRSWVRQKWAALAEQEQVASEYA